MSASVPLRLTGRKVPAREALAIGACERVVPDGTAREAAETLAREIARFPQGCLRADRRSVYLQHGLPVVEALHAEWDNSAGMVMAEGLAGAMRFSAGRGRLRRLGIEPQTRGDALDGRHGKDPRSGC